MVTAALLIAPAASAETSPSLDDLISVTVSGESLGEVLNRIGAESDYTFALPAGVVTDRPGPYLYIEPSPASIVFAKLAEAYGLCAVVDSTAMVGHPKFVRFSSCENAERLRKRLEEPRAELPQVWLGIVVERGDAGSTSGASDRGARVVDMTNDGSVAHAAGIRIGDLITAYNGTSIEDGEQLVELVRKTQPGDEVAVVVDRGGRQVSLIARFRKRSRDY
jgi:membrane-associated protease RseP (regulator of RpoE activity)